MIRKIHGGVFAAATALALAMPAAAQTIDYGSLEQLFGEAVTTSATGKPQRASDVAANMVIITADEIRRTGAANIPDVLQTVVGVDVSRWSLGSADVAVRGYNSPMSPRLLVLVNGRQVYLDHYGMTQWNAIPVEMGEIRQIEVVKGPNTALFGFNAVGGVVNIVTYNPLYDDIDVATGRVGTQNHRELSAVTTVKLHDRIGLRLSAGGYNADEFEGAATGLDPRRRSASASLLAQVTPNAQLGADVSIVQAQQHELIPVQYAPADGDIETISGKVTYTANTGVGLVEATVYRNVAEIDYSLATMPGLDFDNTVTVAKLQDLFKIGTDHSFRLSGEYRRNEIDSAPDAGGTIAYDVYSAGGMWDWALTGRLNLVNAVRVDHLKLEREGIFTGPAPFTNEDYDQSLTEFSVNSGIVYKPTGQDTIRLTYARGVQTPSLAEYGLMMQIPIPFPPFASGAYGNPEMDPTIVTNYEIGYDRGLAFINGALRTSVYYQTNEALKADMAQVPMSPAQAFANVGDSKAVGAEATLNGAVGNAWIWQLGYAFEKVSDDFDSTALNFEDGTPQHKVSGRIGFTHGGWEADVFGLYVAATDVLATSGGADPTLQAVDAYALVSARLGYNLSDNTNVAVTASNLTRSETTVGPEEERRILFSLTSKF